MTYDLSRFSPQSFERFVQALAISALGPTVQIFGVGRDGAWEATYTGKTQINGTEWNGYIEVQAKYRQFPESPAKNADWLGRRD
jgi:hypothetical protein